ncbi:hypothetical protein PUV54_04140 [Hyphococcus flavus]|uniref:DUF1080 domain-containing protein n=1 Tax=Hyphococcus flavus TaxID=1866326 RepID=A0AAF0CI00_9PROT|nr:hypothetical protein [Hyphococcus flavus]WDI32382.1 hypothetical protein PUV54_04140 [Hyphococcus flavus]
MRTFISIMLLCLAPALTHAQEESAAERITFEGKSWRVEAQKAVIERYLDRDALVLAGGRIWLDDMVFEDGVIEFDVAFDEGTAFIGPMFRAENDSRFEEFYFRTHLSEKPDAVQYTPVENGLSAWQIFSDENAIAPIKLKFGAWNHVKIVVKGDMAEFYFNSDTPQLHVPDLKTDIRSGTVGHRSSGFDGAEARLSNLVFRPLRDDEGIVGAAKDTAPLPEGLISSWSVSAPFAEAEVADALTLPQKTPATLEWRDLEVETNGIANLARLSGRTRDENTVFVRLDINSDSKQMKELTFGYSDRVRIYLNGKRVYFGDAGWTVRDYRFLGTVGFFDRVGLDLKKGDNEVMIAVSETFGGWAWAGAMEDQSQITLGR